jgi:APA family basic amino acid/polyamine antiporter
MDISRPAEETQAVRKIGFIEFILINTGLTIGFGTMIFVPLAASIAGPSILLVLFLAFIVSLVVVMSMAEIATIFPYSGGPIYSIRYGLPPRAANIVLMLILLPMLALILGSGGTESLSFAYYIRSLIPALAILGSHADAIIACLLVVVVCGINILGVKIFSRTQFYILGFMFVTMIIWGALSIPHTQMELYQQPFFMPGITPLLFLEAVGLAYWAFVGTELGGTLAGEVKYPLTILPKGFLISVMVVFLVNAWVIGISLGLVPAEALGAFKTGVVAEATRDAGAGIFAVAMIALAAAVGAHPSTINANLSETGRTLYATGKEGVIPGWFGRLSSKFKTPVNALIFVAILFCVVIAPNLANYLGAGACVMSLVLYIALMMSIIMLKKRKPNIERPFKVHMVLPILAIVFSAILAVGLTYYIGTQVASEMGVSLVMGEIISIALGLLFAIIGIVLYFATRKTMEAPPPFEEFRGKIMKVEDDETIPEKEWTELRAPMRATGEALRKINRQYRIMLAVCLSLIAVTAAFTAYIYFG